MVNSMSFMMEGCDHSMISPANYMPWTLFDNCMKHGGVVCMNRSAGQTRLQETHNFVQRGQGVQTYLEYAHPLNDVRFVVAHGHMGQ